MNNINERLKSLRKLMKENGIDTYLITKFDPHLSEYSPLFWHGVEYISGFSGSAGTVVITEKEAGLWTDGRYYIQAPKELEGSEFIMHKAMEPGVKGFVEYIKDETKENGVIGFDGRTVSMEISEQLEKAIEFKNITIVHEKDLLGEIWENRPSLSNVKVYDHLIKYCGKSRKEKIAEVRKEMEKENADVYVIPSLDDFAWLFNLRGNDVENITFFAAYGVIDKDNVYAFIHKEKTTDVVDILNEDGIILKDYHEAFDFIKTYDDKKVILINPARVNYSLYNAIKKNKIKKIEVDITTDMKSIKNPTEIANLEITNVKDGVAMVKFIKWVKETVKTSKITECEASDYLANLRSQGENYLMTSFDSITGYGPNAAMMHYFPKPESCAVIENKGMLLVDSGGNYLDGTTDITRTFAVGEVTDNMKEDFTLVLKSHISLTTTTFLEGSTGSHLDIMARTPMWKAGKDYKCGTGHGIGFCLNVHEGPQGISRGNSKCKLKEGMIITNEPGYYLQDNYGIRTENTITVVPKEETMWGKFYTFRTISYCPIDLDIVNKSMLTDEEIVWLNEYHQMVYDKLESKLNDEEKAWLKHETRNI